MADTPNNLNPQEWERAYEFTHSHKEKLEILKALFEKRGFSDTTFIEDEFAKKLGMKFVDSWVSAMKWEELCNQYNLFVDFLRDYRPSFLFESLDTFVPIYNLYATDILTKELVEDKPNSIIYKRSLYNQGQANAVQIVRLYANAKAKSDKDNWDKIEACFYTDDAKTNVDTLQNIEQNLKEHINVEKEVDQNLKKEFDKLSDKEKSQLLSEIISDGKMRNIIIQNKELLKPILAGN